jgi:uncharacterized protein
MGSTAPSALVVLYSMWTGPYIEFVLKHRPSILFGCGLLTALALWVVSQGVFASSIIKLFFGDSDDYRTYRSWSQKFSNSDLMVVAIEGENPFTQDGWKTLQTISEELSELSFIEGCETLTNAIHIQNDDDTLLVQSYAELYNEGTPIEEIKGLIQQNTVLQGTLLSSHDNTVAILLEFVENDDRPVETMPTLLADIHNIFKRHGIHEKKLHEAGLIPESVEATNQAIHNVKVIFPFTGFFLIVAVYLLFRQIWPVAITSSIALISIVWTFAIAIAMDPKINIMMAMIPAVSLVVAFSDIIHLCSSYMLELRSGLSQREAILKSGREVGQACFYTSVTTFVGFVSLAFIPVPIFRHTGIVLGVGVGIALLLAMTLVPIALSYLPAPKVDSYQRRRGTRMINRITSACQYYSMGWPKVTVSVFALVGIVSIAGVMQIKVETSMVDRLDKDNRIQVSRRFMQEHFQGTNFIDLFLTAKTGDFLNTEHYHRLAELGRKLTQLPGVDGSHSFVDIIERIHEQMGAGKHDLSRQLLAQYMLLFEMSGSDAIDRMLTDDKRYTRISLRTPATGFVSTAQVGEKAKKIVEATFGQDVDVYVGSLNTLFGRWINFVMKGQRQGLLFAIFTTTIMMILCLKLLGPGLWSMVPNLFPLLTLGGYCGWAWDTFDSDTIVVCMIAIGIAVDDTIHFMTRLRIESRHAATVHDAVQRTLYFSGGAIVKTTIILVAGFAPFATSDYFTTQIMGTLLPLTLVMALVSDLLLIPALIQLGVLRIPLGQSTT